MEALMTTPTPDTEAHSHVATSGTPRKVARVEVWSKPGQPDAAARRTALAASRAFGKAVTVRIARVYLIEGAMDDTIAGHMAQQLLGDPIVQRTVVGVEQAAIGDRLVEVHYLPGVMDPVAQSTQEALADLFPDVAEAGIEVRTGFRYDIRGAQPSDETLRTFAGAALANPVIQDIHLAPFLPQHFLQGAPYELNLQHVSIRDLDDAGLQKLSREGHLFLSLDEMRGVRDYYLALPDGREPTDVELETLAQTWSEHCVHKTLKSTVRYHHLDNDRSPTAADWKDRPGHTLEDDGTLIIDNLLKRTVAAATHKLMEDPEFGDPDTGWCVSVFEDNAGIVRFDDELGVCIKVETHNHPSAIEPYGGAATGIGGCIRDIMGTGLAAKPIANTNNFCVAFPGVTDVPAGVIPPRRVLEQVVAGIRDYGNRMGIPTVNGSVWFHGGYLANPLVFAGCIGSIPLDKCFGDANPGDRIIALGGRTGRDGIHGATFSSAELTDTHADEFSHAVQIGNAITEKKTLDVLLEARDHETGCLFSAITDCGAGGFSSAIGEMGEKVGAFVTLETAPLKYAGLSYTEIWISEAQERMVLAVPQDRVATLSSLCEAHDVEMCDLGRFGWSRNIENDNAAQPQNESDGAAAATGSSSDTGNEGDEGNAPLLVLTYKGHEVGRLSMGLLHDGIPTPVREASWRGVALSDEQRKRRLVVGESSSDDKAKPAAGAGDVDDTLVRLLSHPNIASKHWIIRQYDHEVQGGSVIKPLVGPKQDGPSDAAVVRPRLDSSRAIAVGSGLQSAMGEETAGDTGDSYWMTLAAIDEAVRNLVCTGADPTRIALLDNFCWPATDNPDSLGCLVRAAEACYDGALAYRAPFVSGKDSLNNQFTTDDGRLIAVPPTLLITAMGMVHDVRRCVTMDAKAAGNRLLIVGETTCLLGGTHWAMIHGAPKGDRADIPRVDLKQAPATAKVIASLIAAGKVASAHDCSDGGALVAAAEMAFAGRVGLDIHLAGVPGECDDITACFAETPGRYLLEINAASFDEVARALRNASVPFGELGVFAAHDRLTVSSVGGGQLANRSLDDLRDAWLQPLDW